MDQELVVEEHAVALAFNNFDRYERFRICLKGPAAALWYADPTEFEDQAIANYETVDSFVDFTTSLTQIQASMTEVWELVKEGLTWGGDQSVHVSSLLRDIEQGLRAVGVLNPHEKVGHAAAYERQIIAFQTHLSSIKKSFLPNLLGRMIGIYHLIPASQIEVHKAVRQGVMNVHNLIDWDIIFAT